MRRLLCFVVVLLLVLSAPLALAHSGRTDSQGGHYDHSTGEYHFHHGMSAHQHPNGICPYAVSATVKPAATAKPKTFSSVNAYRSDTSVKTATAKPTAVPVVRNSSKGVLDVVSTFHMPIIIILAVASFFAFCLASARKSEYESLGSTFDKINNERLELTDRVKELSEIIASLESQLRSAHFAEANANDQTKRTQEKLSALQKQFDDLYSIWFECQLKGDGTNALVNEAMVYVGASGIYHTRIHGDWHNYRLIPLSEALALRYRPCSLCVPTERFKS